MASLGLSLGLPPGYVKRVTAVVCPLRIPGGKHEMALVGRAIAFSHHDEKRWARVFAMRRSRRPGPFVVKGAVQNPLHSRARAGLTTVPPSPKTPALALGRGRFEGVFSPRGGPFPRRGRVTGNCRAAWGARHLHLCRSRGPR
jgi:hypothetical protein